MGQIILTILKMVLLIMVYDNGLGHNHNEHDPARNKIYD